ncbi:MAG: glycosyltransferase family 4 protein [Candidatus Micrarchaeaceae archaeon]
MARSKINLGIVSQTPVVRLSDDQNGETIGLHSIDGRRYVPTIGGVAPLIKTQLSELLKRKFIDRAVWFSLNPNAPKNMTLSSKVKAVSVYLEGEGSKNYTNFKEEIWKNMHNLDSRDFTIREYLGYFKYNSRLAEIMLQDHEDISLFEIHDFQQLLLGAMLGPSFPSILRWHGPFFPEILNKKIRKFIVNGLEGNDAVIVSTKRDLEGLIRAGYKGRAYQIYPHVDNSLWKQPGRKNIDKFCEEFGIGKDDFLIVNVARMDEIKSQDDLIKAVATLKRKGMKLMLIGGSSFTSKDLGHPKGELWIHELRKLVRKLRAEKIVIFAGSLDHSGLESAYSRADLFVLPSKIEGFGLVVVESWLYSTPAIVSRGAGVSELIMEDINGLTFRPGDYQDLAMKILRIYKDSKLNEYMGKNARNMSSVCYSSTTVDLIMRAYKKTIENFG